MPPKKSRFKHPSTDNTTTKTAKSIGPVVLYWHRTDLRLHDSPALTAALALKPSAFYPIWTWDPHYVYKARGGANRWRFLIECMTGLSEGYQRLSRKDKEQQLWVVRDAPDRVLPKLWKKWGVDVLVFEEDSDWYARRRDERVMELAKEAGVEVVVRHGRTLFEEKLVVKANGGKPTMSMGQLKKAAEKLEVPRPASEPESGSLPGPGCDVLQSLREIEEEDGYEAPEPEYGIDVNEEVRTKKGGDKKKQYGGLLGPNQDCGVPALEEMAIESADALSPHHGGESNALAELKRVLDNEEYTATFEKPKTAPTDFSPRATTVLSPHLHFGSLGIRQFYWGVQDVFAKRRKSGKKVAPEPMNLIGQLLFRDMYFASQYALGDVYQREEGNPVVRVIDWHLPSDGKGGYEVDKPEAEQWFLRWKEGRTGFPFIDALMRQLKSEGWIHHLGRHMVACFLTRGGCYVHWERGREVFEEWLLDHESASNAGNWMW
jgi:cryptochrome